MLLQDHKVIAANGENGGVSNVPGIRSMWDGGLSDAVKERFDALRNHLTPPILNGKDDDNSGLHP